MKDKLLTNLRQFGIGYTVKKIGTKLFTGYCLGPLRINRKLSASERKCQENMVFAEEHQFSILVPLYNTPEKFLREMIESVTAQTYGGWQLCMADGSDEEHSYVGKVCGEYVRADSRICYQKLQHNLGISENTNACIAMAEGDYIALFDHDDLLHPSALYEMMRCIEKEDADFLYTDEATFQGRESHLLSVHVKPDFCMENLRANNYICHFTAFKKELLGKSGLFRTEFDGSQDHDMILRLCEKAAKICHIPKVLYFWRAHPDSVALNIDSKQYAVDAGVRAVRSHLERCGLVGDVTVAPGAMSIYNVIYKTKPDILNDVLVLQQEEWENDGRKIGEMPAYVLLLSRGLERPGEEQIRMLAKHMVKPEVAAVTCKIVGTNGKILSGGVELWKKAGKIKIKHLFRKLPAAAPGYMNRLTYATGIPVICNGCALVRREFLERIPERERRALFDMEEWVKWSLEAKKSGYELISENRAMVTACHVSGVGIPLQANTYNDIMK